MALTRNEGTEQSTLDILGARIGFSGIGYAKIDILEIDYTANNLMAVMSLYPNKEARDTSTRESKKLIYAVGCQVPSSEFSQLKQLDDRDKAYRFVEYILHYQDFASELETLASKDKERVRLVASKREHELKRLQRKLGIEPGEFTMTSVVKRIEQDDSARPEPKTYRD